jgi:hypothetical protein
VSWATGQPIIARGPPHLREQYGDRSVNKTPVTRRRKQANRTPMDVHLNTKCAAGVWAGNALVLKRSNGELKKVQRMPPHLRRRFMRWRGSP